MGQWDFELLIGSHEDTKMVVREDIEDLARQVVDCGFHLHVQQEDDLLHTLDFLE